MTKIRWTVKHKDIEMSDEFSVVDSMSLIQTEEEVKRQIGSSVDWFWQIEENDREKLKVLCFLKNNE